MSMSSHILRMALRGVSKVPQRAISTSPACAANVVLDQSLRDEIHPKIGSREIVGFGLNGSANYVDRGDYPMPAIRFKEDNAQILALKEKEKGDWSKLTVAEKKELYRASFCQTFAEMEAPTGEYKKILAVIFFCFGLTGWLVCYMKKVVVGDEITKKYINREARDEEIKLYIKEGHGHINGPASWWDYENNKWKF